MNLQEAITTRQNYLSRSLAGCCAIDPLWVLTEMENIPDGLITDLQARRYISAVAARRNDLEGKDPDEQSRLVVRIASELHLLPEYLKWITIPFCLYDDAPAAILELKKLAITKEAVAGLQDWIREIEVMNR